MTSTPRTLTLLQLWHLGVLALLPFLVAAFRMVSEPYDPTRTIAENILMLGGVLLSSYSFIYILITGKTTEPVPSLWKAYRQCLTKYSYLLISNSVTSAVAIALLYLLLAFRQVEFLANSDVEVYVANEPDVRERLGFIKARVPVYLRLSIGVQKLVFKDTASQDWVTAQAITVRSIFAEPRPSTVWVSGKMEQYETLR